MSIYAPPNDEEPLLQNMWKNQTKRSLFGTRSSGLCVCGECGRMPKEKRQSIEQEDEIFGFLKQSHISAKNINRLKTLNAQGFRERNSGGTRGNRVRRGAGKVAQETAVKSAGSKPEGFVGEVGRNGIDLRTSLLGNITHDAGNIHHRRFTTRRALSPAPGTHRIRSRTDTGSLRKTVWRRPDAIRPLGAGHCTPA